ncbi:hypothetical protein BOTBODRAFT_51963 [Botryobasidium botryosum FD-172 SS1]|uniref:Uncharacterized protein n=1 Tax=Botryobasidium botryosum (strain FD-172 SS1) TaxID=930990 RepID=A0A067MV44_BOTB1|nr:hypothetical protein BOTBODRAFT_51963 [Botryobasidium botryosum FD-172 SS1]
MLSYNAIYALLAYITAFSAVLTPIICVSAPAILYSPHLASDEPSSAGDAIDLNQSLIDVAGASYMQLSPKSRLSLLAIPGLEDVFVVFSSVFFCTVAPLLTLGGVFTIGHMAWNLVRCAV